MLDIFKKRWSKPNWISISENKHFSLQLPGDWFNCTYMRVGPSLKENGPSPIGYLYQKISTFHQETCSMLQKTSEQFRYFWMEEPTSQNNCSYEIERRNLEGEKRCDPTLASKSKHKRRICQEENLQNIKP